MFSFSETIKQQIALSKALDLTWGQVGIIFTLQVLSIFAEGIGISLILPILQTVNSGSVDLGELPAAFRIFAELIESTFGDLSIGVLLGSLVIVVFVRQGFQIARQVYGNHVRALLTQRVRLKLFSQYISTRIEMRESRRQGAMLNDVSVETERAVTSLLSSLNIVALLLNCLLFIYIVVMMDPLLSVMAIVAIGAAMIMLSGLLKVTRRIGFQVTDANRLVIQFMSERMRASRLISLCVTQTEEIKAAKTLTEVQQRKMFVLQSLKSLLVLSIEPVVLLIAVGLFYFSIERLGTSFEVMILFFVILIRLLPLFRELLTLFNGVLAVQGSLSAVHSSLKEMGNIDETTGSDNSSRERLTVSNGISIENVSFSYSDGDTRVLESASIDFKPGSITAIVGPSGSGKSTLVDLLPRLRVPESGSIKIDGRDIADIDLAVLRKSIAFVSQHPELMDIRIREFLGYGCPEATESEIIEAAKHASAHEFISRLPAGYDTRLGEYGDQLSGGELQRLDLARALVRNANILICDEPTSHLDPSNHRRFMDVLGNISSESNRVIIVVSHRMELIDRVDQLVLMVDGRVLASGRPEDVANSRKWAEFQGVVALPETDRKSSSIKEGLAAT
ncbi:MAG: ABC transporter ATP-binding protein [Alphaproteobacteria bacterium]